MSTTMFENIINHALEFMRVINSFTDEIMFFMFSSLADVFRVIDPLNVTVWQNLINILGLREYSLFTLMLTGGIAFYLIYQFATWLANIVT